MSWIFRFFILTLSKSNPSINNKNRRRTMKTRNIFKTLAFAMMMPAMLLTTACSSEDELANNKNIDNTETTINKGFSLPVTVNVTRQGDSDMRATYNESTRTLEFSAGDQLFVSGCDNGGAESFAGVLDYDAVSGKFSGTIYTENEYSGTADALFTAAASNICATLLPAGYKDHGYLVINTNDPDAQYDDSVEESNEYTLATSKADGVAQFSYERATAYSSGFALAPKNAILNFTVIGLAASTSVNVSLTSIAYNITGTVTTDAFGTATFAAGIMAGLNLQPFSLTVGGKNITIVSSDKDVAEGKIYNITRSTGPAMTDLSKVNSDYTAEDGEVLTGTLNNYKIALAAGANVTLVNVTINNSNITCQGNANIVLVGTNRITAPETNAALRVGNEGTSLTISGSGTLYATGGGGAAGIGTGLAKNEGKTGGNITINGGTIIAKGSDYGAGIGCGATGADSDDASTKCGDILITGGTVTATGGIYAAGIGTGAALIDNRTARTICGNITITGGTVTATTSADLGGAGIGTGTFFGIGSQEGSIAKCGNITIVNTVTQVTAGKGNLSPCSIGKAGDAYWECGTITIGGTVYADGITDSPYVYQP